MTTLLVGMLVAGCAAWVLTFAARWVAPRIGAMDRPDNNFRKLQAEAMPRMGGVPIFFAVLVPIVALILLYPNNYVSQDLLAPSPGMSLAGLLIGGMIALAMGFLDDLSGLRPRWKLIFQAVAATVAYFLGFAIDYVNLPLAGGLHLGWLSYPFTLFWFLACMNAINLADGLDGLAAGLALFTVLLLTVVGLQNGHTAAVFLAATVAAAIFGFLLHNFNPAAIYLGDSGSMLLGFWVAALGICCSRKTTAAISLLIPMIALGLPILDTSLAILRRWVRRLPISAGDRQHIHHILLRLGLSHRNAVLVIYAVCVVLGTIALITTYADDRAVVVLLVALLAVAVTFASVFGDVSPSQVLRRIADDLRNRSHSDEARIAVNQAVIRLQTPCEGTLLWAICGECFPALGLDHVQLILGPGPPEAPAALLQWQADSQTAEPAHACALLPDTWAMHFQIRHDNRLIGELIALQHLGTQSPLPEISELLYRLRDAIQANQAAFLAQAASSQPQDAVSIPASVRA